MLTGSPEFCFFALPYRFFKASLMFDFIQSHLEPQTVPNRVDPEFLPVGVRQEVRHLAVDLVLQEWKFILDGYFIAAKELLEILGCPETEWTVLVVITGFLRHAPQSILVAFGQGRLPI